MAVTPRRGRGRPYVNSGRMCIRLLPEQEQTVRALADARYNGNTSAALRDITRNGLAALGVPVLPELDGHDLAGDQHEREGAA